jgi:hypothetical protein
VQQFCAASDRIIFPRANRQRAASFAPRIGSQQKAAALATVSPSAFEEMAMSECLTSVSLYDTMRACMTENRQPEAEEIDLIAAKIWRDAYSHRANLHWAQVESGSVDHRRTVAAACAALGIYRGGRRLRTKAA